MPPDACRGGVASLVTPGHKADPLRVKERFKNKKQKQNPLTTEEGPEKAKLFTSTLKFYHRKKD